MEPLESYIPSGIRDPEYLWEYSKPLRSEDRVESCRKRDTEVIIWDPDETIIDFLLGITDNDVAMYEDIIEQDDGTKAKRPRYGIRIRFRLDTSLGVDKMIMYNYPFTVIRGHLHVY
eukprot:TRINITY_DN10582_c0_g2_i1.p1 TRINITY_DN10582_c0_g2~~TRINITY_DN10582_c0_g2_i1.p1  ORF type:complete len:117 (-),score=17.07 TRINITY_DN10582_c0_g2_i1:966-1316(-)